LRGLNEGRKIDEGRGTRRILPLSPYGDKLFRPAGFIFKPPKSRMSPFYSIVLLISQKDYGHFNNVQYFNNISIRYIERVIGLEQAGAGGGISI
jgi:hypothetical protein